MGTPTDGLRYFVYNWAKTVGYRLPPFQLENFINFLVATNFEPGRFDIDHAFYEFFRGNLS